MADLNPLFLILVPFALAVGVYFVLNWDMAMRVFLFVLPLVGILSIKTFPAKWPLLFKDIAFVIPVYVGYFFLRRGHQLRTSIPSMFKVLIFCFVVLIILQCFNPSVPNFVTAAIGVKVWLMYIPLIYIGASMLPYIRSAIVIFRIMVASLWIPAGFGVYLWYSCMTQGYVQTITYYYGSMAASVSQGFEFFNFGAGKLFRISSTFTYVVQYFNFCLTMIMPAYVLRYIDTSFFWRRFATVSFVFICFATIVSGARAAFVFVPIELLLIYGLHRGVTGALRAAMVLILIVPLALSLAGIDMIQLFNTVYSLLFSYGSSIAAGGLMGAVDAKPFGFGTGMNTGAARYARGSVFTFGIENYYAKALIELGLIGGLFFIAIVGSIVWKGLVSHFKYRNWRLKVLSAGLIGYIAMMSAQSFKGWPIDIDPVNIYYWLFVGFLFRLEHLNKEILDRQVAYSDPSTNESTRIVDA